MDSQFVFLKGTAMRFDFTERTAAVLNEPDASYESMVGEIQEIIAQLVGRIANNSAANSKPEIVSETERLIKTAAELSRSVTKKKAKQLKDDAEALASEAKFDSGKSKITEYAPKRRWNIVETARHA
jgi:hypothetical protein